MANQVDLNSDAFHKADEEYRRKIREEKYGPPQIHVPQATVREANLSGIDAQFLIELNEARSNPAKYADILARDRRPHFTGMDLKLVDCNMVLGTSEGVAAVDEGIRFLRAQAPLNRLVASAALTAAAADGARHTCSTGAESSNSLEQAAHYGRIPHGNSAELISFGDCSAREAVLRLIVDDGDRSRAQRQIIFDPTWKYVGVASGSHPKHEKIILIAFVTNWKDK